MARKLVVEIVGDSSSLERSFGRSAKAAGQFDRQVTGTFQHVDAGFTRLQKIAVGGLVGGAAFAGLKSSLDAASDLQEQMTKVGQVFQDSADETVAWSQTTANAFGVSQRAALTAAGTFGNLFNTVGLAPQKAAAMSRSLVELAADLASFNNVDPGDALDALRSGLIGEAEPLRRFGVLLSETRVQQEAMRETGKRTAASLTDQEKALARYTLILKDTAPAHGDFARTADGAANAGRRLSANLADLQANLSSGLVPALAKVTGGLADLTAAMQTTQITAQQLASDKGLRDKFADAFGVDELFKVLNSFQSAGLANRIDESFDRGIGGPTKKDRVKFALDAILGPINDITKLAKTGLGKSIGEMSSAIAKAAATAKLEDSFSKLIANLQLGVDRAGLSKQLDDDLKALMALKAGLERQVKAGVDVAAAQSQLVQVEAQILAKQQEIADQRARQRESLAKAEQARQFRALGLDAAGDKPPPSIANLKRQLAQLSSRDDLTGNQKGLLERIRGVLVDPVHKATKDSRKAIKEMFDTIRAEFDKGNKSLADGPFTKGAGLNTKKLLADLGLDPDQIRALRSRLSGVSSAGLSLAGTPKLPTGNFATQTIVVENHNTTTLDGEVVARSVTRSQQVTRRRNPKQKRGPNRSGI